jgi:transcription termination/antitermination protein NusA
VLGTYPQPKRVARKDHPFLSSGRSYKFSQPPSINMTSDIKALFEYYEKEKGIAREKMIDAMKASLLAALRKSIGPARELRIEIDPDRGNIRAFAALIAKEEVTNKWEELPMKIARKLKPDVVEGDPVDVDVTPKDMGRIAAQTFKQTMLQKVRQVEKENLYEEFRDRAGDVVSGVVRRYDKNDVIVDLGKFEGCMPSKERVSTEDYNIGDRMRFYVKSVEKEGARGPEIVLSRAHPNFVRRLFEFEVAEISDGTVEIISISREAGYRTKVAVHADDDKVDPVGACVGMKGARVKNIVRELNNEKVDIIHWTQDPETLIREALKPIKIRTISVDVEGKVASITVSDEDLSKAIGRKGQNARLTSRLVGYELNIDKDTSSEEKFAAAMDTAAHVLMDVLGVSEDVANKLADNGFADIRTFAYGVDVSDIADILDGDTELAARILTRAQSAAPVV